MKKLRTHILAAMAVGFIATPVMADDYYDDLYAPQRPVKKVARVRVQPGEHDYLPADAYSDKASNTLRMDVDRYNRRGNFLVGDPKNADSLNVDDTFAFTRRIERYHNPEVVTESGDTTLVDYYYTSPGASNINVYLVDNTPGYYNWAWRYGNPWYWNVYGPAYTGWGGWGWYSPYYDPYWSYYGWNPYWNYGYGWGWGWDPYWDYGWGWGHGHGHWGGWYPGNSYKPTSSGAYRPHGGGSSGIAGRNPGSSARPADRNQWTTNRPGNMGRPTYSGGSYNGGYTTAGTRPGTVTAQPGTRPSTSQGTYTPYGAGTRGRNSYGTGGSSSSSRNSYGTGSYGRNGSSNSYNRNGYNTNTNSNRSSYNSSSSSSSGRSYNSGSSGSYQSRGGGSSGGSYSGGGGGGRGRR